jgi:hypothetical protein
MNNKIHSTDDLVSFLRAAALVLQRSIREVCGRDYGNEKPLLDDWCANGANSPTALGQSSYPLAENH